MYSTPGRTLDSTLGFLHYVQLACVDWVNYCSESLISPFYQRTETCPIQPKLHKNCVLIWIYVNQSELLRMTIQNRTI